MIADRTQLAAKSEETEGTAETLAGADALLVANPVFRPDTPMNERPNVGASLSPFSAVPGARHAVMEFDVELKGSGAAGTAPEYGTLLKACGFSETVVESTSVTYAPASSSIPSLTMAFYMDGVCKKIWGARGDVSLKLDHGGIAWLHFVFTGADFSVTDVALLTSGVSYQTTVPPAFLSANFQLQSYAAVMQTLEIAMNNELALRPDVNQASGYLSARIARRRPTLTFDPELVTVATHDFYGILRAGTLGALTAAVGATAGNICTITAPKVQYTTISPGDRSGIRTEGIDCKLSRNSGDDELSLAFT